MMALILATDFDFIAFMSKMAFFWKLFSCQWCFWNMIRLCTAEAGLLMFDFFVLLLKLAENSEMYCPVVCIVLLKHAHICMHLGMHMSVLRSCHHFDG